MSASRFRPLALAALLFLVGAATHPLAAQDQRMPAGHSPGAPSGAYALSDLEQINLFNGVMSFRLPLLTVGSRGGAGYTSMLTIEQHWGIDVTVTEPEGERAYPRFEWFRGYPPGYGPGTMSAYMAIFNPGGIPATTHARHFTFHAPDGSQHDFRDDLTEGEPRPPGSGASRGRAFRTNDGSQLTFVSDLLVTDISPSGHVPNGQLMFPDGTRYRIDQGNVSWIQDRNGNVVRFEYELSPSLWPRVKRVTDALNRVVGFSYVETADTRFDTITFQGWNGLDRTLRIDYARLQDVLLEGDTQTLSQLFPGLAIWAQPNAVHNPWVVASVTLPNTTSYSFHYNVYSELAEVILPTGGIYRYAYGPGSSRADGTGLLFNEATPAVYRRLTQKSTFNNGPEEGRMTLSGEEPSDVPGPDMRVTVRHVDPRNGGALLSSELHYFFGKPFDPSVATPEPFWRTGLEAHTKILDAAGTELRSVARTWEQAAPAQSWLAEPRVTFETTRLETAQQVDTIHVYDTVPRPRLAKFEHLRDTVEHNFDGSPIRRRHFEYVTTLAYLEDAIHLRHLVRQEDTYEGVGPGSALRARTIYDYDNYAEPFPLLHRDGLSGRLSATSYGTGFTLRGNVTAVRRWLDTTGDELAVLRRYDIAGNVVAERDPKGNLTEFDYADNFGEPDGNPFNHVPPTELGGLSTFAFVTRKVNPKQHTTFSQYHYFLGQPVDLQDANGVVSSVFYDDDLDRPTASIDAQGRPVKTQTRFVYHDGPNPRVETFSDKDTFQDGVLHRAVQYDSLGRPSSTLTFGDATATILSDGKNYDAMGRAAVVYNPFRMGDPPPFHSTTTSFDALGRVSQVEMPDHAQTSSIYSGNVTTVSDPASKVRRIETDSLGRVTKVVEDPGGLSYETTYAYNVFDQVVRVTQGAQTRTFAYDSLGRLLCASNPESRVGSTSCSPLPTSGVDLFSYDANGNLVQRKDARGRVTDMTYDALDRVETKNYSDTTPDVTYTYDGGGVSFSKGRLTSVSSSASTMAYTEYDPLGRVRRSRQDMPGPRSFPVAYTYDLAGNLRTQTYPSGRVVTTAYDAVGRFHKVSEGTFDYGRVSDDPLDNGYAAHGGLLKMRLGNGRWQHMRYNCRLQPRLAGLGSSPSSAELFAAHYNYGTNGGCGLDAPNNGNVLSQVIQMAAPTAATFTQTFGYDNVNRLKTAVETIAGQQPWFQTYDYDRFGNRAVVDGLRLQPELTPDSLADYDGATSRILASGYDLAGNQTGDGLGRTFTYDAENRQVTAGSSSYAYDGDGRRVLTTVQGATTIFVYDVFGKLLAEYGGGYGPAALYLTPDILGSTRIVTDSAGAVFHRLDFLPFGEEIPWTLGGRLALGYGPTLGIHHKFTGKERDSETALDYFGARYFSGPPGRFTSVDPGNAAAHIPNPQTWNGYAYTLNNPLKYVDPDGESATVAGAIIGGAFGAGAALIHGALSGDMPSLRQVGAAAAGGAVAGAMVGSVIDTGGASLPVLLATGALSGAAGVATKNAVLGRGTSVGELAEGAAWGMATAPAAAVKGPVVLGSLTPRPVPQVIANQAAGNALRDRVADGLRKMGRTVEVEVEKKTPLGVRRLDLEVSQDGKVLGGIETKLNNSPYTPSQRAKDWYLEHVRRYWVDLIRVKEN